MEDLGQGQDDDDQGDAHEQAAAEGPPWGSGRANAVADRERAIVPPAEDRVSCTALLRNRSRFHQNRVSSVR